MAHLKNKEVFSFKEDKTHGALVSVGNNRQARTHWIQNDDGTQTRFVECFLHGHNVATFAATFYPSVVPGMYDHDPRAVYVVLNACGYRTTTTRAAMGDFLEAMACRAGVSFAGGKFSARVMGPDYKWREIEAQGDVLEFHAARGVPKPDDKPLRY